MKTRYAKQNMAKVQRVAGSIMVKIGNRPAYYLLAERGSKITPTCTCNWGSREGTRCQHVLHAIEFLESERAQLAAPPVQEESLLEQMLADGDILLA